MHVIKGLFCFVLMPHANGTCGGNPPHDMSNPISDWRAGVCHAHMVTVDIPLSVAGDFVYHCHILEHEDGGMMARIRVRPILSSCHKRIARLAATLLGRADDRLCRLPNYRFDL